MAARRRSNWHKPIWACECEACGGSLKKGRFCLWCAVKLHLPGYTGFFQFLWNFPHRTPLSKPIYFAGHCYGILWRNMPPLGASLMHDGPEQAP